MTMEPWIIERLEEEERERREQDEARRSRIELPQTRPATAPEPGAAPPPAGGVQIVDISPRSENTIDV
jgi:hypothetical protein